ncbi:MAG TPA: cytochrome b [Caulobacteraceae bacterium]|nr:cytochrome b [Caulobacteraceae bacterium]
MTAALSRVTPANATAERSRYSSLAIALHWLIALLIIGNIALAWYVGSLRGLAQVSPLMLHKSIGITVLLLSLARLGWRLAVPPPKLPAYVRGWERLAAQGVHVLFYALMLGLPLSGWAWVSSSPLIKVHPTVLFGLVPWPAAPLPRLGPDQLYAANKAFGFTHKTLAKIAYATIALHVLAALKHQFLDRDDVVARMIPFVRRSITGAP